LQFINVNKRFNIISCNIEDDFVFTYLQRQRGRNRPYSVQHLSPGLKQRISFACSVQLNLGGERCIYCNLHFYRQQNARKPSFKIFSQRERMIVGWTARILRISVKGTGNFELTFYFLSKKISHLLSVPRTEIAVYTKVNSRLFHY
jgi:hypothetical protein